MTLDRQGKCPQCKIRYVWRYWQEGMGWSLGSAHCPLCTAQLEQTSHQSQLPQVFLTAQRAPEGWTKLLPMQGQQSFLRTHGARM